MRSLKKMIYISIPLLKKVMASISDGGKKTIETYSRRSSIVPEMVGLSISVYNGKKFIPISVTQNMVGHKLGEFSPTRKTPTRKSDSKSSRK